MHITSRNRAPLGDLFVCSVLLPLNLLHRNFTKNGKKEQPGYAPSLEDNHTYISSILSHEAVSI